MSAVIRGETAIGSTVLHGVINEIVRGFPVQSRSSPAKVVGYEVGSMAIIKGARHLDNAPKFFDWALTPEAPENRPWTCTNTPSRPIAASPCRRRCPT